MLLEMGRANMLVVVVPVVGPASRMIRANMYERECTVLRLSSLPFAVAVRPWSDGRVGLVLSSCRLVVLCFVSPPSNENESKSKTVGMCVES
jgi:hypothetical protein